VQVVHVHHAGQRADVVADVDKVDTTGCRLQQHVEEVAKQAPGPRQDHHTDRDRRERVSTGVPGGDDDHAGDEDRNRPLWMTLDAQLPLLRSFLAAALAATVI